MVRDKATWFAILSMLAADHGGATGLPAYQKGDVATDDVITMSRLIVVDKQATAELQKREAQKINLFVIHSTNHAAFIEGQVKLAINGMREGFLGVLRANYGTHHLTPEVTESRTFADIVEQFLATSPGPPVPSSVLPGWAVGQTNGDFLEEWFAPLRPVLESAICPDRLPDGEPVRADAEFRFLSVGDLAVYVREGFALSNSVTSFGSNLVSLTKARNELSQAYPQERTSVAAFMVEQLQPNCRFDTNLTQRVKDFAVSGLVQMKRFEPGEVVIRKGQVIDERALAVLAEMHRDATVVSLEQQVAVSKVAVQLLSERNLWLVGLLGGTGLLLVVVLILTRRRKRQELVPVLSSSFVHHGAAEAGLAEATVVDVAPGGEDAWQRRALEAERRAERADTLARSTLMPHLAQQLKDNLVRQLATQMDDLLEVQAAVADQLASVEERLERMHAPLRERLRIYEQRISELELELAQRGQENQLLLRAQIEALRWQMEQEKAGASIK